MHGNGCCINTLKGSGRDSLQALKSADPIGLTAAELNAQVLLLRTQDSNPTPLPPEVVAMYNKTTRTERSRVRSKNH